MSDKKNVAKVTENEKVMTKYDRKIQRRKEEAAKAKKEERKGTIIGIALVAALAIFILSFPIRTWIAVNGTYIKVGGEKVTRVEFDFNYTSVKSNYINQVGPYLSMLGIADTSTLEYQMYNDTMTYGDYFAQMTAENIASNKGLKAKAMEAGFTYDTTEDCAELKSNLEEAAAENSLSLKAFLTANYGSLATWDRIKPYFEESLYISAYYAKLVEELAPSEEEIKAEYERDKASYDCVDYRMTIVEAELPTTAPDGTVEKDKDGNVIAYEPTKEEIEAAMKEAKKAAQEAEKTVAKDGEEYLAERASSVKSLVKEFLFDESRKSGDTAIVEDTSYNRYLVVSFDKRYRDESDTYDVRMIYSTATKAQTILDEWKAGEATEESFQQLVAKYDEAGGASTGGLYSGVTASYFGTDFAEWFEAKRAAGDTTAVSTEDGSNYVLYYVGENEVAWKLEAENVLLEAALTAFMEEAAAEMEIEDPKGKLAYLHAEVQASSDAADESTGEASSEGK